MSSGEDLGVRDKPSQVTRESARNTLSQQLETIRNQDQKALRIFRLNLLIVGLLITGISLTFQSDGINTVDFINLWGISAIIFITISSLTAALTYTSSAYDLGISAKKVQETAQMGHESLLEDEFDLYRRWIDTNRQVLAFNSYTLFGAIAGAFNALVLFAGATAVGVLGYPFTWQSGVVLLLSLVLILLADLAIYMAVDIFYFFTD